jgi:hypothetical protein
MLGGRADKGYAVRVENIGELRVLRQKAVAWMHRVRPGDFAGRDNLMDVEVAVARRRRPYANAFVGKPHMHGVLVCGGMNRHGLDPEFLAGAQHPQCDLATVCDQNLS